MVFILGAGSVEWFSGLHRPHNAITRAADERLPPVSMNTGHRADEPHMNNQYVKVILSDTLTEIAMTDAALRPVSIKLDEDTRARVKRLAAARQRSSHWLLREAITQYVEREEKREAFRQDTLRAWEDYRTTGQHVTADEADAWLAELEAGIDTEPPACHD